jgi:hypothetical protein
MKEDREQMTDDPSSLFELRRGKQRAEDRGGQVSAQPPSKTRYGLIDKKNNNHRTSNAQHRTSNMDGAELCLLNYTKIFRVDYFLVNKCRWVASPCWIFF